MSKSQTVSFVNLSDIYDHIGFGESEIEAIADFGFDTLSFGVSDYTLIENTYVLKRIIFAMESYYDELELMDEPSRNIPVRVYSGEEITKMFWEIVGERDYINFEG